MTMRLSSFTQCIIPVGTGGFRNGTKPLAERGEPNMAAIVNPVYANAQRASTLSAKDCTLDMLEVWVVGGGKEDEARRLLNSIRYYPHQSGHLKVKWFGWCSNQGKKRAGKAMFSSILCKK